MFKLKWINKTITTNQDANEMLNLTRAVQPELGAFDTETTGLHIIVDTPFLFAFGFIKPNEKVGHTYVIDLEKYPSLSEAVIIRWHRLAENFKKYYAHNIKFDLHMLENIKMPYTGTNVADTMTCIRFAHDAVNQKQGGPPLKQKDYTQRFIDHSSNYYEKQVNKVLSQKAKTLNLKLKERLKCLGAPPCPYKAKSYTLSVIDEMFKDCILGIEDLSDEVRPVYQSWLEEDVPQDIRNRMTSCLVSSEDVPFTHVPRELLTTYAHFDIMGCLEIAYSTEPVIKARETDTGVRIENDLIHPLVEMERVGFKADAEYLENSRVKLKAYIKTKREELFTLTGRSFKLGQHALIKEILNTDYDLEINSTENGELTTLLSALRREQGQSEVVRFIELLQELRTLEKWYSAYIIRFQNNLRRCDRLYTTIHQVGAVSGRVSSDFQQFPKQAILDDEGNELFHPRRVVLAEPTMVFLDYSQIELRFQALFTILVGSPDLNLCRAYMPHQCYTTFDGKNDGSQKMFFDYNEVEHIRAYKNHTWFLNENPQQEWEPTDVHGATTTMATGLTPEDEGFKRARGEIGKRTNFAKNYGARYKKICEMFPDKSPAECKQIDEAYYKAFPGVREYHTYCYRLADESAYAVNLFGVKYYGVNGHKLINMLIQGSAAYFLKLKILELHAHFKLKGYKSCLQMQVHDELIFKYDPADPPEMFTKIKEIMENWEDTLVPIVADIEVSNTNWAEKKEIKDSNDLQIYLSRRP